MFVCCDAGEFEVTPLWRRGGNKDADQAKQQVPPAGGGTRPTAVLADEPAVAEPHQPPGDQEPADAAPPPAGPPTQNGRRTDDQPVVQGPALVAEESPEKGPDEGTDDTGEAETGETADSEGPSGKTLPDPESATPQVEATERSEPDLESSRTPTERQAQLVDELSNNPQLRPAEHGEVPSTTGRVIAIANQKGGVGKTTTTVNLGAALAELGYRVLIIDLDPQGNATTGLGIDARNFECSMYDVVMHGAALEDCLEPTSVKNLFLAPSTIDLSGIEIELVPAFSRELRVRKAVDSVRDDFDFVLIDCPPSLGLITINGLAAASELLVPIQCEYYALEGISQLLKNVRLVASNLNEGLEISTIVLTMYDARTRLSTEVAADVRKHFGELVCRTVIPRSVRLSEAPSYGQPITVFDASSRGAIAYRELAKEVSHGAATRAG
jgi:chromosome partitioning protein